jgi:hypothetical protein
MSNTCPNRSCNSATNYENHPMFRETPAGGDHALLPYSDIRRNEPSFMARCGGSADMIVLGMRFQRKSCLDILRHPVRANIILLRIRYRSPRSVPNLLAAPYQLFHLPDSSAWHRNTNEPSCPHAIGHLGGHLRSDAHTRKPLRARGVRHGRCPECTFK